MHGSQAVRSYYDQRGWVADEAGVAADEREYGHPAAGPQVAAMWRARTHRVRLAVHRVVGDGINLLECGCGGNPSPALLPLCRHYTGVDFSETGLALAAKRLGSIPHTLKRADVCELPFSDGEFDAVYCAHVIYHIPDPEAQRRALLEMVRVLRPGGALLVIAANPRPLLYPGRLLVRALADSPLGPALRRIRPRPLIDYRPMPRGWFRRVLAPHGLLAEQLHELPSVWARQHLPERGPGRLIWAALRRIEATEIAALGCYVQYCLRKHDK